MKKKFSFSLNKVTLTELNSKEKKVIIGGNTTTQCDRAESEGCSNETNNWCLVPTSQLAGCDWRPDTRFGCNTVAPCFQSDTNCWPCAG